MMYRRGVPLVAVVALAMAGCSGKNDEDPPGGAAEQATAVTPEPESSAGPADAPPAAPPAQPEESEGPRECQPDGITKCDGEYRGDVKAGNKPPLGANIMECHEGRWVLAQSCEGAENEGCYLIEDPGSGRDNAVCVSTFSAGE